VLPVTQHLRPARVRYVFGPLRVGVASLL
jgi:hypothetical protein